MLDRLSKFQNKVVLACVFTLAIVLTFYAYMASYEPLPLLEEFYLLEFFKNRSTSMMGFLTSTVDWNGPLPDDSWGMFASGMTAVLSNLSNQSLTVIRTVSILLHATNCALMFFVTRDALAPPEGDRPALATWLAAGACLIFALYPLAPEAVSYIGGQAYLLGTTFFLTSFYLYMKGKRERNWTILGVSWISFLFAVVSDHSLWSSGFIMVALELSISFIGTPPPSTNRKVPTEEQVFEDAIDRMLEDTQQHQKETEQEKPAQSIDTAAGAVTNGDERGPVKNPRVYDEDDDPDNLFETLVPCLPLIVLGVLLSIRALPSTGNEQLPGDMIVGFSDWGRVFKHLFFPINEAITPNSADANLQMWCIYAIPLLVSLVAIVRSRQFRRNAAFLFAWLIVIIVPHLHTAIGDSFLIGSRLAYSALVPASAMIALFIFSPGYALIGLPKANNDKIKILSMALSLVLISVLSFINLNRTVQQTIAYNAGAKHLEQLTGEVKKIATGSAAPYVFIRNAPTDIGMSDIIKPKSTIVFDSQTKILRAAGVPQGFLKDALNDERYRNNVVQWDSKNQVLQKIEINATTDADPEFQEIKNKAELSHVKTEKRPDSQVSHIPVYSRLTYNYPNLPQLGLLSIDRKGEEATLKYDTSMIENAHGALVEICRADTMRSKLFPHKESEHALKTVSLDETKGEIKLPGKHFKSDGVYSIRVFATNKEGKLLGNASDEIHCSFYSVPPGS
ncbi:MAG: hypothetical protein SGJ27_03955 [Candidatus Melainabacteria bacterium]|nr:hypothetical protein [Candidatus Melainabacteria bacterium]